MRNVVFVVLAATVFGVAVYWWQKPAEVPDDPAHAVQPAAPTGPAFKPPSDSGPQSATPDAAATPTSTTEGTDEVADEGPPNYRHELRDSPDLLSLAQKLHALAQGGDAAAQYWLHRTLARCGAEYNTAFANPAPRGENVLSLDQALQQNSNQTPAQAESLRRHHDQCVNLRASNPIRFGLAGDWLQKAYESGYPLALADGANRRAYDAAQHGGCGSRNRGCTEARTSALTAVRSGDPEVLVKAGNMLHLLSVKGDDTKAKTLEGYAWTLAGCIRGADCSQSEEWVRAWCRSIRDCQPGESGADFIRRETGASFAEIERRAQEIGRLIDANQWDELQFH